MNLNLQSSLSLLVSSIVAAWIVGCALTAAAQEARKDETLTNGSILELQKMNLGDGVILEKIRTSKCDFDVTIDGLRQLKEAKVSDAVIQAMISAKSSASAVNGLTVATGDPNDPNAPHAAGVYLYEEANGQKKMTKLMGESASISGGGGPFGGSQRAVLSGLNAKLQLTVRRPVFYMYLGKGGENQLVGGMTPAQLPLVQLDLKDNKKTQIRSVVIGSHAGGPWSSSMKAGIEEKFKRPFDEQEMSPGVYRVTPQNDLTDGEYGFVHVSGGFAMAEGQIFCFGIHSK
jgi:hypothetical protein